MRHHTLLAALLAVALLAGCGGNGKSAKSSTSKPAGAATSAITIKNFLYSPDPSTVKVGQKVSVTNDDAAPHTLTEKSGSPTFDSGTILHGHTKTITFTKPGTYKYYCQFHATMSGTVTVTQ